MEVVVVVVEKSMTFRIENRVGSGRVGSKSQVQTRERLAMVSLRKEHKRLNPGRVFGLNLIGSGQNLRLKRESGDALSLQKEDKDGNRVEFSG